MLIQLRCNDGAVIINGNENMQLSAEAGGMNIERIAQLRLIGTVGAFGGGLQFGVALAQHFRR